MTIPVSGEILHQKIRISQKNLPQMYDTRGGTNESFTKGWRRFVGRTSYHAEKGALPGVWDANDAYVSNELQKEGSVLLERDGLSYFLVVYCLLSTWR